MMCTDQCVLTFPCRCRRVWDTSYHCSVWAACHRVICVCSWTRSQTSHTVSTQS